MSSDPLLYVIKFYDFQPEWGGKLSLDDFIDDEIAGLDVNNRFDYERIYNETAAAQAPETIYIFPDLLNWNGNKVSITVLSYDKELMNQLERSLSEIKEEMEAEAEEALEALEGEF